MEPSNSDEDVSEFGAFASFAQRRTSSSMTEDEERERRASIQEIMQDPELTPLERRRSIQALMDGRRRSSDGARSINGGVGSMSMTAAAAAAAAEFYSSEDSDMDPSPLDEQNDDDSDMSSHSSGQETHGSNFVRRRSFQSFQRKGRSASLKEFASSAQAAAAAAAAAAEFSDDPVDVQHAVERMEKSRPGCEHYDRNCTIISPCCGLAFGCRICHDDCPVLPPPTKTEKPSVANGWSHDVHQTRPNREKRLSLPVALQQEEAHHTIDRFAIAEVICRQCFARQSSKTNNCVNCKIQFGDYHCSTCNLWMSSAEDPYHCIDCGFCRVGGRENFTHCHDCGMCIDAILFNDHNCNAGKYMSNCPVCQEDLFSSRCASHEMPCGHAIHWHCFRELTSFDTRCPVCKKTAETHEQMAPTWSAMAVGIALQPVPPEMTRVVHISCNDCGELDDGRRWHFLGVQCLKCSSFNTTIEKTVLVGMYAAAYLGDDADGMNGTIDNATRSWMYTDIGGNGDHDLALLAMEESLSSIADDEEHRRLFHDRLRASLQLRMEASINDDDMSDSSS